MLSAPPPNCKGLKRSLISTEAKTDENSKVEEKNKKISRSSFQSKMPQRQDSEGAVCMGIFFDEFDFFKRGVYLVLWATIHTYVKLNHSRLCI